VQTPAPLTWDQAQKQPRAWYATPDAARIARNVCLYQRNTGGWPKNLDMAAVLSPDDAVKIRSAKTETDSTIDNGATTAQVRYLASVYASGQDPSLRDAAKAGLDYLLAAQYSNGGWPQYFPLRANYSRHITFNDDAMTRVMTILDDIARAKAPFEFVDAARRARSAQALARGLALTLRLQIRVGGQLTGWGQQYDETTLAPAEARTYEHASIASMETVGVVRFLMTIDRPGADVITSVDGAVNWLRHSAIRGIRLDRRTDASLPHGFELTEVPDPAAPALWARFYAIGTNAPIYSGRDGVIKSGLADIEVERRTGYSWLGPYAAQLLAIEYPAWTASVRSGARSYNWRHQS